MAQNHIQEGAAMPYTNATAADIASGDVVLVGNKVCVALGDIAIGASASLACTEVWELPKVAATVIGQGATVYWDATAKVITNVATANTLAGFAFVAAASADATIQVKLAA